MSWSISPSTLTVSALIIAWVALQIMALVQGVRFHHSPCNQPLSTYLITSPCLLALAVIFAVLFSLNKYILRPAVRNAPRWREDFFSTTAPPLRYEALHLRRAPIARFAAPLLTDGAELSAGPVPTWSLYAKGMVLRIAGDAILPTLIPHQHSAQHHPNALQRYPYHVTWQPPRSTCYHVVSPNDDDYRARLVLGPFFFSHPEDDRSNALPKVVHITCNVPQITTQDYEYGGTIPQRVVQERWRPLTEKYAFNGVYSGIPPRYFGEPVVLRVVPIVLVVLIVLSVLAGLAWLIYGTIQIASLGKGGTDSCVHELYQSAMALAIGNWLIPVITMVISLLIALGILHRNRT